MACICIKSNFLAVYPKLFCGNDKSTHNFHYIWVIRTLCVNSSMKRSICGPVRKAHWARFVCIKSGIWYRGCPAQTPNWNKCCNDKFNHISTTKTTVGRSTLINYIKWKLSHWKWSYIDTHKSIWIRFLRWVRCISWQMLPHKLPAVYSCHFCFLRSILETSSVRKIPIACSSSWQTVKVCKICLMSTCLDSIRLII